jgi:hypothetical protein
MNDNQSEFRGLKDQLEKLVDMFTSYKDNSLSVEASNRLAGLSR